MLLLTRPNRRRRPARRRAGQPSPFRRRRMVLERLEDRRMLATDAGVLAVSEPEEDQAITAVADCGCQSKPPAPLDQGEVAGELALVDAAGAPLSFDEDVLLVAAATWCGASARFVEAVASPENAPLLEGLRIVFVFENEGGAGPGGVLDAEFLEGLPVAFLAPGSVSPTYYPSAYNPESGQFDTSAFEAVGAWLAADEAEAVQPAAAQSNSAHATTIFVTSRQFGVTTDTSVPPGTTGEFGGMEAADWYCTLAADNAGLLDEPWDFQTPIWRAYLSDATINARDRLEVHGPVYNLAGDELAADADEFWSTAGWKAAVLYNEFGDPVPTGSHVWTGSAPSGITVGTDHCGNWSNPLTQGIYGVATSGSTAGTTAGFGQCSQARRLYCLSPSQAAAVEPTIEWAPISLTYGEPLSEAELNAVAMVDSQPVAGTYNYSPALGTVLDAGTTSIDVLFTPDDTTSYTTATASVLATVDPAALSVAVDDATKVYGDANPAFTVSYDGFVLGQDQSVLGGALVFDTLAEQASDVGSYAVSASGLTSSNYAISFVDGVVDVTPAPLTVTADDATWEIGTPLPEFTASYDGFVLGQDQSVLGGVLVFNTTADQTSTAGTYPITPGGLVSGNYDIAFVDGTLTVTPAVVQIDLQPASLNLDQNGAISLVIFGSSTFDVSAVDVGALKFAGVSIDVFNTALVDANQNGTTDLMIHFKMTETLRAELTNLYGTLLEADYAEDDQYDKKQDALIALDGAFGEYGQEFEGSDTTSLFLAGRSLKSLLEELGISA